MSGAFTVSCIQFTSARDYEPNIRVVSDLVRRARDGGADFVMTPENTGLTEPVGKLRREKARDEANHPVLAALREVAQETGVWLLIGSLAVDLSREPGTAEGEHRLANRSYLVDPGGAVVAHYDKIHMFDVDLAGGESYRESNAFRPIFIGRSPRPASNSWRSPRPSRCRPAKRIGMCCCGRGQSKMGALCLPRRNGASMPKAGGPTATR